MKDSFFKKYWFSLQWQAKPKCFKHCWGVQFSGTADTLFQVVAGLFQLLGNILLLPLHLLVCIIYPVYHLVYYPVYAATQMEDGLIDKINEKFSGEKSLQSARFSEECERKTDELLGL